MKNIVSIVAIVLCFCTFTSCNDGETYAEQRDKERAAISQFITDQDIKVISEEEFFANDSTTDVSKNEYVLFNSSGVYMQVLREGCGEKIKDGESLTVLCRFDEYNLLTDSLILSNNVPYYAFIVDKMTVTRSSGTYYGVFVSGSSLMASAYSSTSVPDGWLTVMPYVRIGRPANADEQTARVRLIVPHSQGQAYASQNVYPCFYDITFERGI